MRSFFVILVLSTVVNLFSQNVLNASFETGVNNVSEGAILKLNTGYHYNMKKFSAGADFRSNLLGNGAHFIDAFRLNTIFPVMLLGKKIDATLFYHYLALTDLLYETNPGLLLSLKNNAITLVLGTHVRTFSYSKSARNDFNIVDNYHLTEWFNLIYELNYQFVASEKWKADVAISNFDKFLYHQETNPFIKSKVQYAMNGRWKINSEILYITSGALNLHVNSFGFLLRLGVSAHF